LETLLFSSTVHSLLNKQSVSSSVKEPFFSSTQHSKSKNPLLISSSVV